MPYLSDAGPGRIIDITPSDTTTYDGSGIGGAPLRALLVTVTGDVVVTDVDGNDHTFPGVPAYTQLVGFFTKVKAATSATVKGYPARRG